MKSILLHVQDDGSLDSRIEDGLALARATSGHLSCIHVTPIEAYVAFDAFGGVFAMTDVISALDEQEKALSDKVQAKLASEDVSWDYEQITGSVPSTIVRYAALCDVVVVGRDTNGPASDDGSLALLGDLLQRCRPPLLIPGTAGETYDPAGPLMIAWNGSYEAANAVRSALGLMAMASRVRVVRVDESGEGPFQSTRLMEYLSRHGVHADLHVEPLGESLAGEILLDQAVRMNAQTIVLGGYGHSRIGEYLFGGVTRSFLDNCPIAILVAH